MTKIEIIKYKNISIFKKKNVVIIILNALLVSFVCGIAPELSFVILLLYFIFSP